MHAALDKSSSNKENSSLRSSLLVTGESAHFVRSSNGTVKMSKEWQGPDVADGNGGRGRVPTAGPPGPRRGRGPCEEPFESRRTKVSHFRVGRLAAVGALVLGTLMLGVSFAGPLYLVCKYVNLPDKDLTYIIDFQARTVDGYAAQVSDTTISWEQSNGAIFLLSRLTGEIKLTSRESKGWYQSGTCQEAKRQF